MAYVNLRSSRSSRPALRLLDGPLVAVSALLLGVLATFALTRAPDRVGQVTVTNPTDYEVLVEVQQTDGGWMPLSLVAPRGQMVERSVLDPGPTWVLRFSGQGRGAGDLTLDRSALAASDWHLEVPSDAAAELRRAGAPPTPTTST